MDIIILFFIAVLIYLLPMNDDYLGVKTTLGLKGFLALGIIFHHLSQWVTTGSEFSNFAYMGTWSAPCQVDRKIIKVYDEFIRTRLFIYAGIFNPIDKVILFLL